MADVFAGLVGVLVLAIFACGSRAWWVARTFLPAAANVESSSYTGRLKDQDAPYVYGWYTRGKPGVRLARDQVRFEDANGNGRTASVSQWVSRRYRPLTTFVVWYDPLNPARATANGPAYWLGFGAVLALGLGGLFVMLTQFPAVRF